MRFSHTGGGEPTLRTLEIPAAEIDEPEPERRLRVCRVETERHFPLVGGALEIPAIGVNAREHIVRVSQVRMAIEPAERHAERDIQLAGSAQRVGEPHEYEARRITRQLIAQAADLVSHP